MKRMKTDDKRLFPREMKAKTRTFIINLSYIKDLSITIIIIVGVVALGFLGINQATQFFYTAQLAMDPCELCCNGNPEHVCEKTYDDELPLLIDRQEYEKLKINFSKNIEGLIT